MISKASNGISVIICCYNSSWVIGRCLDALKQQKVDKKINWEIVIVDNNCTDNTVEIVESSLKSCGIDFTIVHESNPGLLNARKRGVATIKYPFIVFCDDDNLLSSNYVEVAFKTLSENPKIGALGGKGIAEFESEPNPEILPFIGNYAVGSQKDHKNWLYGAGMAVRTELVKDIYNNQKCYLVGRKGDKLLAGDDTELSLAIALRGYEIEATDEITFKHVLKTNRLNKAYLDSMLDGFVLVSPVIMVFQMVIEGKNISHIPISYLKYLLLFIKSKMSYNNSEIKKQSGHYIKVIKAFYYWRRDLINIYREWNRIASAI